MQDNLDSSIERGFAGASIFFNNGTIVADLTRAAQYARLLSSIRINAVVVNNVNANATILTAASIEGLGRIADAFRPYGVQLGLSLYFSSPTQAVKGRQNLTTFDPLDQNRLLPNRVVVEGVRFADRPTLGFSFQEAPVFYWLNTLLIVIGAGVILVPNFPLIRMILVSQIINGMLLPVVLTTLIMMRSVKNRAKLAFNLLPSLGVSALLALLAVPLMSSGLTGSIVSLPLWSTLQHLQTLIISTTSLLALLHSRPQPAC